MALGALALAMGAGCSMALPEGGGRPMSAREKAYEACRHHADEVYSLRNPGEVYRRDLAAGGQVDAPFGGTGGVANPSQGLAGRYSRDLILQNCLNGTSVSAGGAAAPAAPAAKPVP
jgi:hypothetical protein